MLMLMIGFSCSSFAQIQRYQASSFAFARVYNGQYSWSDWERSSVVIDFNLNKDVITIYSQRTQYYYITSSAQTYRDSSGGTNIRFNVIDGERDRGNIRLRVQTDGTSQIYVDFNDCAWVYGNVVRIQ